MGAAKLALSPYSVLGNWVDLGLNKLLKFSVTKSATKTVGGYDPQKLIWWYVGGD